MNKIFLCLLSLLLTITVVQSPCPSDYSPCGFVCCPSNKTCIGWGPYGCGDLARPWLLFLSEGQEKKRQPSEFVEASFNSIDDLADCSTVLAVSTDEVKNVIVNLTANLRAFTYLTMKSQKGDKQATNCLRYFSENGK